MFKVDISQPPICPPNIRSHDVGFFGKNFQTKESKQEQDEYEQYLKEYRIALNIAD